MTAKSERIHRFTIFTCINMAVISRKYKNRLQPCGLKLKCRGRPYLKPHVFR